MTIYFDETAYQQAVCSMCGVVFLTPASFDQNKRNDHTDFYCPNGHPLRYKDETAAEKYKRLLEDEQKRCEKANSQLRDEEIRKNRLEMKVRAHKGVAARLRKKIVTAS